MIRSFDATFAVTVNQTAEVKTVEKVTAEYALVSLPTVNFTKIKPVDLWF